MLKIYNTSIFPILMLGCLPSQVPKVTKKLQCGLLIVTFLNGQQMGPWGYVTLGSGPSAEKAELHAISNFPKWAGAEEVPGGGGRRPARLLLLHKLDRERDRQVSECGGHRMEGQEDPEQPQCLRHLGQASIQTVVV